MTPVPQTTNQRIAAFGPYIVDVQSGQLRKHGTKVKLGEQPFRILLLLLERQGVLVTREELQATLWATDTFVDFERSLNSAVQRLRDSLSDTAEKARWIETVPRRGYRFAGHVVWSGDGFAEVVPESSNGHQHSCDENVAATVNREVSLEQKAARRVGPRIAALVVGTLILCLAFIPVVKRIQHVRLANKDTIVLADFTNSTGDAVFDDTLNAALHISLRQSPFLNVLSDGDIATILQQMTRPPGTRLTPGVARELCLRVGSKAYLAGSIGNLGSQYVLELKAVNCQNGDTLAQEQVVAASKERVLDSLGSAASKLREALGESLASIQRFDVPLEQATTVSLEALKAHTLGRKVDHEQGAAAALPYDMQSIDLDPNFAMGYLTTGGDYEDLGQRGRARDYYAKAFELRQHASERERLRITAVYYDTVTGELYKAAQAYQQEIDSYPRESMAYFSLAYVYSLLGQYEKAVEVVRQGMRTIPADRVESLGGGTLFTSALALQRFDEAQLAIDQLQSRKVDDERIHLARYILCILGSDSAAMAEQEQWFAGKPNFENLVLALASDTQAYTGHLSRSRELTDQAVDAALRTDSKETAAKWLAIAAQREAAYGYAAEARQKADEALELAPEGQGVENGAALAIALLGDTAKAESLAKDLEERYPLDTQVHLLWLPAILGRVELDRKNPAQALKGLQASSSIEYGGIPSVINNSCLYHVYVRGEAYLAMGKGSAAAAEFQKILDHRGLVWNCWTGDLAHLEMARANTVQARDSQGADANAARIRALSAYKDFLTLWKDADPDIPVYVQAKAEYAKLQELWPLKH